MGEAVSRLGVWGLAFKPETDDIREAPALSIIEELLDAGASMIAYDPEAMENVKAIFGNRISYAEDHYQAAEGVDALLIITEWAAFRNPDFQKLKSNMKSPVIFDGRNLYQPETLEELGFYYESIGRKIANESIRSARMKANQEGEATLGNP